MKTQGVKYLEQGGAEIVEIEVLDPEPGEVQLESGACGICALDLYAFRHGTAAMPFTPPAGHEGVSHITKIGQGVEGFKEGQRVAGGSFARVSNVKATEIYPIPASDQPDEYWVVEPVSCVVTGIDLCNLRPGDRVAVVGCGFMGLLLVQGLAHSYAEQLIGIDINPKRLELAKRFGADAVFDASEHDLGGHLEELRALEIDTVVETSGTQAGLNLATRLVRTGGRISEFGWIHGNATVSGDAWHLGGFTIVNPSPFGKIRDTFPAAIRLMKKGIFDLRPLVTHVVPLEEYPSLCERIADGEEPDYIKGVVKLK